MLPKTLVCPSSPYVLPISLGEGDGTPLQYSCLEKPHGWKSLVGYSPWGHEESDTTERPHFHFSFSCIGEGNGKYSCLENPRDGRAWWAVVYGVAQSRTRLKRLSSSSSSISLESQPVVCLWPAQLNMMGQAPPASSLLPRLHLYSPPLGTSTPATRASSVGLHHSSEAGFCTWYPLYLQSSSQETQMPNSHLLSNVTFLVRSPQITLTKNFNPCPSSLKERLWQT